MRRADREITDYSKIEEFIAQEQILRVAFWDEGEIYIVPVNYGYTCKENAYTFYFHGAKAGRKYALSSENPKVGFEIDGKYKLLTGEAACEFSAEFQSVIGTGRISLVTEREEKIKGLNTIMKQTSKRENWTYEEQMLSAVAVFRLDVEKMSCKAK